MEGLLGVLKEDVGVAGGAIEVEEAQVETQRALAAFSQLFRQPMRGGQLQA